MHHLKDAAPAVAGFGLFVAIGAWAGQPRCQFVGALTMVILILAWLLLLLFVGAGFDRPDVKKLPTALLWIAGMAFLAGWFVSLAWVVGGVGDRFGCAL